VTAAAAASNGRFSAGSASPAPPARFVIGVRSPELEMGRNPTPSSSVCHANVQECPRLETRSPTSDSVDRLKRTGILLRTGDCRHVPCADPPAAGDRAPTPAAGQGMPHCPPDALVHRALSLARPAARAHPRERHPRPNHCMNPRIVYWEVRELVGLVVRLMHDVQPRE